MTELKDIKVPPSFARSEDQADFYRRGWSDAKSGKKPSELKGYPPALNLAYAMGGLDATAR